MNRHSPVLDELLLLISDIETEIDMRKTRTAMIERQRRVLKAARSGSIRTTPVSPEAREAYEAFEASRRASLDLRGYAANLSVAARCLGALTERRL
ncbi:MAG: hypothetical protein U0165_16920 [Polyangiaceae bacterium]